MTGALPAGSNRPVSSDTVAVSLHIYQAPIEACSKFQPQAGEWYVRLDSTLRTDAAA